MRPAASAAELDRLLGEGQIDIVWGNFEAPGLAEKHGLVSLPMPPTMCTMPGFIGKGDRVLDVDLRRALSHCVDREALARALPAGRSLALGGPVPSGIAGHTPNIALRFDPAAARGFLEQSTHRGPVVAMVAREQFGGHIDLIAQGWRDNLGIEISIEQAPMATDSSWPERAHLALWSWIADVPDPGYFLHNLFHSGSATRLAAWPMPHTSTSFWTAPKTPPTATGGSNSSTKRTG